MCKEWKLYGHGRDRKYSDHAYVKLVTSSWNTSCCGCHASRILDVRTEAPVLNNIMVDHISTPVWPSGGKKMIGILRLQWCYFTPAIVVVLANLGCDTSIHANQGGKHSGGSRTKWIWLTPNFWVLKPKLGRGNRHGCMLGADRSCDN